MAQVLDSFNRSVQDTQMSLEQLRKLIRSLSQGNVGKPTTRNDAAQKAGLPTMPMPKVADSKTFEEIRDILKEYKKEYEKDVSDSMKHVEEAVDSLKALEKLKEDKKNEPKPEKQKPSKASKEESTTAKALKSLEHHATKKGSLYTHDIHTNATLKELRDVLRKLDPTSQVNPGVGKGRFIASTNADAGAVKKGIKDEGRVARVNPAPKKKGIESDETQHLYFFMGILNSVEQQIGKIEEALFGLNIGNAFFKGIIKEETQFIRDSRAAAYEVQGITKEARGLQRAFEDIGTTASTTGMGRSEYQKDYLKNLKKGIRDLNTLNKVTTAQLNTERMIGVEAGSLNEEFSNWNTAMRMNSGQVAEMGRGIRDVAKFTGVTGEKLAEAVKSSGDFIKGLRNAATLTAATAKNIIEIQATAQKMGTADTLNPLMKAMTNTNNLIREASNQTRALLINAAQKVGRVEELMTGTILKSKAGIKDMAAGLEANLRTFGINSLEEIDNLSDAAKQRLNLQLKAAFGIELGEMRQTIETLREAGKGMGDRIADINKKLKENITVEERAALMEQARAMKASASLSVLNALDESAKGAQDMNQALAKFGQRRKEFEGDLNAMGITATDNADVARQAIGSALENINKSLKAGGKTELKIDSSQIEKALQDPVAFRELQATLTKAEQQAAVAAKSQLDPISEIKQKVTEMNDNIRNMSQNIISKLLNSMLGKLALIAIAILSILSTAALFVTGIMLLKQQIGDVFKNIVPMIMKLFTKSPSPAGTPPGTGPDPSTMLDEKKERKRKKKEEAGTIPGKTEAAALAPKKEVTPAAAAIPAKTETATGKCDPCIYLADVVKILNRIAECVCKITSTTSQPMQPAAPVEPQKAAAAAGKEAGKKKLTPEEIATRKAAGQAAKQKDIDAGISPAVAKSIKRQEVKNIKMDKTLNVMEKKNQIQDLHNGKKTAKMSRLEEKSKAAPAPPTPPSTGWDLDSLMKAGPEMAKTAAAILIMAVGVVALGAALVFLANKVIKAFNLDIKTVLETAAVVGAIAVAGGAIAIAAYGVIEAMQAKETQDFIEKSKKGYEQLLYTAAAILVIGPAIVALGAAVVAFSGWILKAFKLNLTSVLETSMVVVAVAGAATAIIVAASEALECMETMDKLPGAKKLMNDPMKMAWMMLKGAAALLIIGPAIILLGAALVKFSQWILGAFGLDSRTAIEVGKTVAAVLIAAGIIGAAVIGAMFGLYGLGLLVDWMYSDPTFIPHITQGAIALMILAPLVLLLAGAIIKFSQWILGAFGLSSKEALETGYTVAAVIISAGLIAGAIIGAMYGLYGLGLLAKMAWKEAGTIALGAAALFVLTPVILLLATAVVKMSESIMSAAGIDGKKAMEVGKQVAGIIMGAAMIAVSIIAAIGGLFGLGKLAMFLPKIYLMILLGAAALIILTPVMIKLAIAIINMANELVDVPPKVVEDIVAKTTALFKGAGEIALAVLLSLGALAVLGLAMTQGWFWIAALLAAAGAAAILILTPVMMKLAHAIINMGKEFTQTISLEEAKKIAEGVKGIFTAAAEISSAVMDMSGYLVKMGFMSLLNMFGLLVGLMRAGASFFFQIAAPIGAFAMSMLAMGKSMTTRMPMEEAKKIAEGVKAIFESAGVISSKIGEMIGYMLKLGFMSLINIGGWIVGLMNRGAKFFFEMAGPIGGFVMSLLKMGEAMKSQIPPQKAKEIADGVKAIFEAAGAVNDALTSQMGTLMKLGLLSWFKWLLPDLDKATDFFMSMARPAMRFTMILIALGRVLVASAGGPKKIKPLIEGIKGIGEIVEAVGKVMDILMKKIVPMTRAKWFGLFGNSQLEDLANAVPKFQSAFESVTTFIRDGIIMPIRRTFKNTAQIQKTLAIAKGLADAMEAAAKIMDTVIKSVLPLTKPWFLGWWGNSKVDDLAAAIPKFSEAFDKIVSFVKTGVIEPIKRAFRDTKKVNTVINVAKGIATAMEAIIPMVNNISKVVVGMTTEPGFLWFSTGKSQLDKLQDAIPKFEAAFAAIVNFVKNGVIEPVRRAFPNLKKVQGTIAIAKGVGEAVAAIATVLDILANKLVPLAEPDGASWYEFWKSDKPDKLTQIQNLIPKFQQPFIAMVNFLKNGLIGPITNAFPNLQAINGVLPIIQGVGNAVAAIANMMDALANKLAPLAEAESQPWYKFWKSDGPSKFQKLEAMIPAIGAMWNMLVYFIRDGLIMPVVRAFPDLRAVEQQIKVVEMVGKAIKTVAEVMETMQEIQQTIDPLAGLRSIFGEIMGTVSPLERSIPMIQSTFLAVTRFIKEGIIAPVSKLDATGLRSAVDKLKNMQKAMELMQDMVDSLQGMMGMTQGSSTTTTTGMWWWAKTVTTTVAPLTERMTGAIPELQRTFQAITKFVKEGIIDPVSALDAGGLKKTVKIMMWMTKAIEQLPPIIEALDEAMSLMSPGDNLNIKFPMDRIMSQKKWFEKWFPAIAAFVRDAIITPINTQLRDTKEIKNAAKILMWTAQMLSVLPSVLENLDDAMGMMSPGDNLNLNYPMDRIMTQKKWFEKWFPSIAAFVRDAIIKPINEQLRDVKEIKNAAKILMAVAQMIAALPVVLENLDRAMGMMSPGDNLDLNYPMDRIMTQKKWFEKWFPAIAAFVRDAIIKPVMDNFKDVKSVKTAAAVIKALACMIAAVPPILKNLDEAMSMMSPGDNLNLNFPMDRIMVAMKWFRPWFSAIGRFVKDAIVDPVMSIFGDAKSLVMVAKMLCAMAMIAKSIPPVLLNLDRAMSMMSPGDNLDLSFPMDRIIVGIKWFRPWFLAIGRFIKEGIVEPILSIFGDGKSLIQAAKLMRAMAIVIQSIPKVIIGLAQAMSLMTNDDSLADAPGEKIMAHKEEFRTWFRSVAIFMRDGIVAPILEELPDVKSIVKAAQLMRAMTIVIQSIPKVIMGIANGLIPLVDSGMTLKDTPADKIEAGRHEFATWFRSVAIFMRDGIVAPILEELPDVKSIVMAARLLRAMSIVITSVATIIKNISKIFGTLSPDQCINDSPMGMIAAATPIYKDWFMGLVRFLVEGIVEPILYYFPDREAIQAVADSLRGMIQVIRMLPRFLYELSSIIGPLVNLDWQRSSPISRMTGAVKAFADYFGAMSNALIDGIILPIMNGFPATEDLQYAYDSLDGMIMLLDKMPQFLSDLNNKMVAIYSSDAWGWGSKFRITLFSNYFESIANALVGGIVMPVMAWPDSTMLQEVVARLRGMTDAVNGVSEVLETFSTKLGPLANGFWWYSPELSDLSRRVGRFSTYFTGIAMALKDGIINPIKNNFPASNELSEVVAQVKALDEVIGSLSEVMKSLATTIAELNTLDMPDLNPEVMGKMAGILQQLSVPTGLAPVEMVSFQSPSIKDMGIEASAAATGAASSAGDMDPSKATIEQKLQKRASDAQRTSSKSLDALTTDAAKPKGIYVSDQAMQTMMYELLGVFKEANQTGGFVTANMPKVDQNITGVEDIQDEGFGNFLKKAAGISMPIPMPMRDNATGPNSNEQAKPKTIPPSQANMDMGKRVQQEKVSSQPQATSISSPELGQIAASSQQTQQMTTQMVALLTALVNYMKPGASQVGGNKDSGGTGTGGTNVSVSSPPKYYKWNTGKANQIAGKGVTNIGSTSY